MKAITVKDLFNALSPDVQDYVKFTYSDLLLDSGEFEDNVEDIALSILTHSESIINDKSNEK